jgi:hypothetical protein
MAKPRVRPEFRRKRLPQFAGLYFSQVAAILTLPVELRAVVLKRAVTDRWSSATTARMVALIKRQVRYDNVEKIEVRQRGMGWIDGDSDIVLPVDSGTKPCAHCGKLFRPKRSDAKYHSPACKQAAYRARQTPA